MKCPNCGGDTPSNYLYCEYCGSELPLEDPESNQVDLDQIEAAFAKLNQGLDHMHNSQMGDFSNPKRRKLFITLGTLFFGWTGIQYLLIGKLLWFLLYLMTRGLFFVGWIYDIYRVFTGKFPGLEKE